MMYLLVGITGLAIGGSMLAYAFDLSENPRKDGRMRLVRALLIAILAVAVVIGGVYVMELVKSDRERTLMDTPSAVILDDGTVYTDVTGFVNTFMMTGESQTLFMDGILDGRAVRFRTSAIRRVMTMEEYYRQSGAEIPPFRELTTDRPETIPAED